MEHKERSLRKKLPKKTKAVALSIALLALTIFGSSDSGSTTFTRLLPDVNVSKSGLVIKAGNDVLMGETTAPIPVVDLYQQLDQPGGKQATRLADALVALEDERFFEKNSSFDREAFARAALYTLLGNQQGGSGVVMQLSEMKMKNDSQITGKRGLKGKIKELSLGQDLLDIDTTQQHVGILSQYLNEFEYNNDGLNQVIGISEMSMRFMSKSWEKLTLAECAQLCALFKNPVKIHKDHGWWKGRRNLALGNMLRDGYITQSEYDEARGQDLTINPSTTNQRLAIHPMLISKIKKDAKEAGIAGEIQSTIDVQTQTDMQNALSAHVTQLSEIMGFQVTASALYIKDGQIKAYIPNQDPLQNGYDNMEVAGQPGSLMKPLDVAMAMKINPSKINKNWKYINNQQTIVHKKGRGTQTYTPPTWDKRRDEIQQKYIPFFDGLEYQLDDVLIKSLNPGIAAMANDVGHQKLLGELDMYIQSILGPERGLQKQDGEYFPTALLGLSKDVYTPMEIAQLYMPLANGGAYKELSTVKKSAQEKHVLSKSLVKLLNSMMKNSGGYRTKTGSVGDQLRCVMYTPDGNMMLVNIHSQNREKFGPQIFASHYAEPLAQNLLNTVGGTFIPRTLKKPVLKSDDVPDDLRDRDDSDKPGDSLKIEKPPIYEQGISAEDVPDEL